MKILLIKPYNLSDHIQPSLGLGYLATAIRNSHEVNILDCIKENIRIDNFATHIRKFNPDVVGIQCYTFDLKFVKEALRIIKGINKNIVTIIGGPHPTALPHETMQVFKDSLDFAFVGEAEVGLPLLLDKLCSQKKIEFTDIPGLVLRNNEKVIVNPQVFVHDLDTLCFPAWDLIHPEEYPEAQHGAFFKNFPIAPILISRGCPYSCTFCAGNLVSGKYIRFRSVRHVMQEIEMLYSKFGIREFHIIDDNFTLKPEYVTQFCQSLLDSKMQISWATPNGARIDFLNEDTLKLMSRSGLYLISLGIESGSDRILRLMKKGITIDEIRKQINKISNIGIDIAGFFIMGFPGETREEIEKTIDFACQLNLIRANFFTYLPFPGTTSYQWLQDTGELQAIDWDRFYFMNAAYAPQGMTKTELKGLQRKAFFKFYLRPHIFLKNVLAIKSLRHLKFLLKRFYHWIIMR